MEPETGATVETGIVGADAVASAPDGRWLLIQRDTVLLEVDLTTLAQHTVAVLGDGWRLGGPGAVGADGRIAVWQRFECGPGCSPAYVDFRLSFVNRGDGSLVTDPGFATVRTKEPSLFGWQSDGDAVVVLTAASNAEHSGYEPPRVVALHPGGGETVLMTLPGTADRIDITRDLLNRFGARATVPGRSRPGLARGARPAGAEAARRGGAARRRRHRLSPVARPSPAASRPGPHPSRSGRPRC